MQKFHLLSILVVLITVSSCRKDKENMPNNNGQFNHVAVGTLDLGNTINADFMGRVIDESGNPLANVLITAGTKTVYTDNKGMFVLKDVNVKERLAYIKAEKSGYFPGSRSLIPSVTVTNAVVIQMMALTIAGTIVSGGAATVTTNDGASIDFNGSYVDASGNPYTGPVTVAARFLPALDPQTFDQMPGMLYAENSNGDAGALVTYGMMVVELYGLSGQSLNIAEGSSATLHMPVEENQLGSAPATIPLWFFDEVAGYWIEEGAATLIDGKYVGEVSHFTFWNCDYFYDACEHNGLVTDNAGNPVGNATVVVDIGWITSIGYTNPDGTFWTYLPAGQNVDLVVSYGCSAGNTYSVGPYSTGSVTSGTYIAGSGGTVMNLTGTLVNCDLQPVTDGYVYFYSGVECFSSQITDGVIDFEIPSCTPGTMGDLYVHDNDQPYSYFASMNIPLTFPTTDVGQLVICDSVGVGWVDSTGCDGEFFEIVLDGTTILTDYCVSFDYNYDSFGNPIGFIIFSSAGYHEVWSADINATGVYPGTDVTMSVPGEVIYWDGYLMDGMSAVNFSTNITQYGGAGGIISLFLTGTFVDYLGATRSVQVSVTANIP